MTVYQDDDDGTAYLICSTDMNSKVITFPLMPIRRNIRSLRWIRYPNGRNAADEVESIFHFF